MRVRCHCQPARLVIFTPWSIQARRPYHPASLASGGSSVRSSQGALEPSAPRARNVQGTWLRAKAMPAPRQLVPGRGAHVVKGRQQGAPVGRKLPPVLMRTNGCQPRRTSRRNRHGAYQPRSASTRTVPPRGLARRRRRTSRSPARRQACWVVAGTTTHATGMAQPR
jgi:hypothetical protein